MMKTMRRARARGRMDSKLANSDIGADGNEQGREARSGESRYF